MPESILDVVRTSLQDSLRQVVEFTPNALSALGILAVSLLVAKIAELLIRRLLHAMGTDEAADRRGVLQPLRAAGYQKGASHLIGSVAFWCILALATVPIVGALRLPYLSELLSQLVSHLPNLVTSLVILLIGLAAARLLSKSIESSARNAGLEYATGLGTALRYILTFLILILALAQAGVQTAILTTVFTVLVVSLGLALALALGLGSRSVVNNLLAGAFARELFTPGSEIEIQGRTGKIVAIRSVGTTLESEGRQITIPNTMLIENIVE